MQARTKGLIVEELGDGAVIYDATAGRAHALDRAALAVWRAADGARDLDAIAAAAEVTREHARLALDDLAQRGLLESAPGVSRRAAVKRAALLGAAAVGAAPVIETVLIPVAAAHASTTANGAGGGSGGGGPVFTFDGTLVEGNSQSAATFDGQFIGVHTFDNTTPSTELIIDPARKGIMDFSIAPLSGSPSGEGVTLSVASTSSVLTFQVFNQNHTFDVTSLTPLTLPLDSSLRASIFSVT